MEDLRLNSSKLGTEEYWNNFYKKELNNFQENSEDEGECWFDDSDAESKMIEFLIQKINNGDIDKTELSILDLGTGNGHLLYQMTEEFQEELELEVKVSMKGIDYSPDSIDFAQKLNTKYQTDIKFQQVDLLNETLDETYDIILDKGTFDAIALNQDIVRDNKIGMDIYPEKVIQLMKPGTIFLITSCNFTEEELTKIMTSHGMRVWDKITYPTFEFGGVKGTTICSIAFIR